MRVIARKETFPKTLLLIHKYFVNVRCDSKMCVCVNEFQPVVNGMRMHINSQLYHKSGPLYPTDIYMHVIT